MSICPVCNKSFENKTNKRTCSRSCSNAFFPRRKIQHPRTFKCVECGKEANYRYSGSNKFCSWQCAGKHKVQSSIERLNNGEVRDRGTLRKLLSVLRGYQCSCCHIKEWNGKPITLQVNHIDGNCTNNLPSNLELICPNCHSQTDTFGAKNKGSGRKSRGLPLHY